MIGHPLRRPLLCRVPKTVSKKTKCTWQRFYRVYITVFYRVSRSAKSKYHDLLPSITIGKERSVKQTSATTFGRVLFIRTPQSKVVVIVASDGDEVFADCLSKQLAKRAPLSSVWLQTHSKESSYGPHTVRIYGIGLIEKFN